MASLYEICLRRKRKQQQLLSIVVLWFIIYAQVCTPFRYFSGSHSSSKRLSNSHFLQPQFHNLPKFTRYTQQHQFILFGSGVNREGCTVESPSRHSSNSAVVSAVNLVKNCVGPGVFSLNARALRLFDSSIMLSGVAAAGVFMPKIALIIAVMASWAVYNFNLIAKTCAMTKSENFSEAWENSVSKETKWLVEAVIIIAPLVGCLSNIIVLSDVLRHVLVKLLNSQFISNLGLPLIAYKVLTKRPIVISILVAILYPLCMMKDLSALKNVSVFGLIGHCLALVVLARRIVDGSYSSPAGQFYTTANFAAPSVVATPSLNKITAFMTTGPLAKTLMFASLLSYCLVTHYNAPRYWTELKSNDTPSSHPHHMSADLNRFTTMSYPAYAIAALIYIATITLSIMLFGTRTQSFALNTFAPTDTYASWALTLFGLSVMSSFPLLFFNLRQFVIKHLGSQWQLLKESSAATALLLCSVGFVACFCRDVGVVGGFSGAILGTSMMFVFPPIMYISASLKSSADGSKDNTWKSNLSNLLLSGQSSKLSISRAELVGNIFLMLCGIFLATVGTVNNILNLLMSTNK